MPFEFWERTTWEGGHGVDMSWNLRIESQWSMLHRKRLIVIRLKTTVLWFGQHQTTQYGYKLTFISGEMILESQKGIDTLNTYPFLCFFSFFNFFYNFFFSSLSMGVEGVSRIKDTNISTLVSFRQRLWT